MGVVWFSLRQGEIRTPGFEPAAHFTVAHVPSHLEKRSVVMTLEDRSHGGHRAVLPITISNKEKWKPWRISARSNSCWSEQKDSNLRHTGYKPAALPAELCSEVHQAAHLAWWIFSFWRITVHGNPQSKPPPRWAFGFIFILHRPLRQKRPFSWNLLFF